MRYNKSSIQFCLLACVAILLTAQLLAQTSTKITIKAGEDYTAVYKQMYRFPEFTYGKVYFMNNDSATGKLNYNMLMGKMQFIDRKGDTLVLADNNPIRLVAIDTSLFYCNSGGCVELLAGFPPAELAVGYHLKFADEQRIGAYGLPTSTQTVENTSSFVETNYKLLLNKDLIFIKETQYYLIDGDKHLTTANKKNIQKLFPKQRDRIEDYIKQKQIDFKNESELKDLFLFLVNSH